MGASGCGSGTTLGGGAAALNCAKRGQRRMIAEATERPFPELDTSSHKTV